MDNKKKGCNGNNQTNQNNSQTGQNNSQANQNKGIGLSSFSYADFILLSSTISYALAEELDDADLALLIVFLGMITSDLALLTTQKQIKQALGDQQTEGDVVSEESGNIAAGSIIPTIGRGNKVKKRKRIKRIKKVRKK